MKKSLAFSLLFLLLLAACSPAASTAGGSSTAESGGGGVATGIVITAEVSTVIAESGNGTQVPFPTPEPPTPIPTLASGASVTELKYRVLQEFPDFFFCDPDFYPIARAEESDLARQRFPEIQANQEMFQAILAHNGLSGSTSFTDEQKLLIYREYKKLNAIFFELKGDKYQFQIQTGSEDQQGSVVTATIDGKGSIDVLQKEQSFPTCPICLTVGTLIDTPGGDVRVEQLQVGDAVWTVNEAGERVVATIMRTGHVRVPTTHHVVHVTLADGRELWASPGHPTADGRTLGDLRVGDLLDGAPITGLAVVSYQGTFTFDILPSGETGFYWANGILVGSTLHH